MLLQTLTKAFIAAVVVNEEIKYFPMRMNDCECSPIDVISISSYLTPSPDKIRGWDGKSVRARGWGGVPINAVIGT